MTADHPSTGLDHGTRLHMQAISILGEAHLWDVREMYARKKGGHTYPYPSEEVAQAALNIMTREKRSGYQDLFVIHAPHGDRCRLGTSAD